MSKKPLIGVIADKTVRGAHPSHIVGDKYITAIVEGSQALAIILPALGKRQALNDVLPLVDGLLFTGSQSNVEPHHYGGEPSEAGALHDPERDATTLPLFRAAVDAHVPILAICRGFQEMNIAFGGTLHQKVHTVAGLADHRENLDDALEVQYALAHEIRITENGMLHRLAQGETRVRVNSLHGQGIERLGEHLMIEALAPDGLIEAISVNHAHAFTLGLQWHPEWKFADDPLSRAIFTAFGAACRQRMSTKP